MMPKFIIILLCLLLPGPLLAAVSLQELKQLLANQQFVDAARGGEEMLRHNGRHTEVRFLTAYAYQMAAQRDQAIAHYQSLIEDNPDLPEPRNNLAMIYLEDGDYDRASQLLVEAIKTHPSYATAYENLSQIYKGIASEAYRRAVSESDEPAKYTHNIRLSAITRLDSAAQDSVGAASVEPPSPINFANQETLLLEQVQRWAEAWSAKDFAAYAEFYSPRHRARFDTHEQWLAQRRARILRPGEIRVEVSKLQIRWRSDSRAIIDFEQKFDSPRYSDRVRKRLGFERIGTQWKITEERVLSVL